MISELSHKLLQHSRYFMGGFSPSGFLYFCTFWKPPTASFPNVVIFFGAQSLNRYSHISGLFSGLKSAALRCARLVTVAHRRKNLICLCALRLCSCCQPWKMTWGFLAFTLRETLQYRSCPASLRARRHFDRLLTEPEEDKQKAENLEDSLSPQKHTWGGSWAPPSQTAF